jgi:hypothetical protein
MPERHFDARSLSRRDRPQHPSRRQVRLLVLDDGIDHFGRRRCCYWMSAVVVAYGFTILGDNEIRVAAPELPQFRSFEFAMHGGQFYVD